MLSFNNRKIVELTFEKRRGEFDRRIYAFDTIQDQKVMIEYYFFVYLIIELF
jgi:hypothetical protein